MTHDDDSKEEGVSVLKCDGRGRVRSTAQQRREVLAEFERSGLSGPAFCRVAGIKYQTFVGWRQAARRRPSTLDHDCAHLPAVPQQPMALRLVEASLREAQGEHKAPSIEVHLPGGSRMMILDAAQAALAAQLLKALA